MAKREIAKRIDRELTVEATTPCPKIADVRRDLDAAHDRRAVRSPVLSINHPPMEAPPARAPAAVPLGDERRRLERNLHDGVQNEQVASVVMLALAQQDAGIPPALAETLAGLEARARAALDAVCDIVGGIYPPQLADFCLARALRAQAERAPVDVSLERTAPRGIEEAQAACLRRLLGGDPERRDTRGSARADQARVALQPWNAGRAHRRRRSGVWRGTDPRRRGTEKHPRACPTLDGTPDIAQDMCGRLVCGSRADRSNPGRLT